MLPDTGLEAINKKFSDVISESWDTLCEVYARDNEVTMTVTINALKVGEQTDLTVKSGLVINLNEKPTGWKPEKLTVEKRIRLNNKQIGLPFTDE
jgi:hypothetical protein